MRITGPLGVPRSVVEFHPRRPRVDLTDPEPEFPADPEASRAAALAAQVVQGLDAHPKLRGELRHRDHAVIEQVIAAFKDGPLAHLPLARMRPTPPESPARPLAFNIARALDNIARALDVLGAPGRARARARASVRTRLINVPARIATTGRRLVLHLPREWPWAEDWQTAFTAATGPPETAPI